VLDEGLQGRVQLGDLGGQRLVAALAALNGEASGTPKSWSLAQKSLCC